MFFLDNRPKTQKPKKKGFYYPILFHFGKPKTKQPETVIVQIVLFQIVKGMKPRLS